MSEKPIKFETVKPKFKVNYDLGWIGFNHSSNLIISKGIAHFTRWRRTSDIVVSHVFIVTGEDECIEANYGEGVVTSSLAANYFDREERATFLRKPNDLNTDIADRITTTAKDQIGAKFDRGVLLNQLLNNNFVGTLLNRVFDGKLIEVTDRLLNYDDRWICSELVGYCLQEQPEYRDRGVLSQSLGTLTPQMLFECDELFEPMIVTEDRSK